MNDADLNFPFRPGMSARANTSKWVRMVARVARL